MRGGVKVGGDDHASWQPRSHSHGFHIWHHSHVGVAGIPRRDFVALDGVVFNVNGKKVVATLGSMASNIV